MKITCLGAAGQVTGSCFLLDNGEKFLVDCGLYQGGKAVEAMNHMAWPFNPGEIAAIFLTHAHIDHCGRIPKLVKDGFRGKIYCSLPTAELCKILLLDSAHIQEMEAEWHTRKNRRRSRSAVEPLYTVADAEACLPLFEAAPREEPIVFNHRLKAFFRRAGHILGASMLEIWSGEDGGAARKIVFSGDLGRKEQLLVGAPQAILDADTLFMESTYGNRNHKSFEASRAELLEAIRYSVNLGEKVMIPAFAVERTQELLYLLGDFFRRGLIPPIPVYLDSPLGIAATEIFRRLRGYLEKDPASTLPAGEDPFDFPGLVMSRTAEDSIAINQQAGPAIVIAGNGMCTAGRIKHHLKHNLWRPGASLVIAGFQAEGSIGRRIVEGARSVRIFGENISVRAKVFTIGGFSAHAGQADLLEWLGHFRNPDMQVCVIHGEKKVSEVFADLVRRRLGLSASVPIQGETVVPGRPGAPRVLREAPEEPSWRARLAETIQKAGAIEDLWKESPDAVAPELLEEMEKELARTQAALAAILEKARKKTS
jgi:metallo-beta-lactamase family protein